MTTPPLNKRKYEIGHSLSSLLERQNYLLCIRNTLQLFWKNSIGLLEDRELSGDAHRTNHNNYFYNWYLQSLLYARLPAYLCAQKKPDHLITIPHWVDGDGSGITEKVKEVEGNPGSISKERRALRRRILRSCQYCHMTLRVWAFLNFAPHPLLSLCGNPVLGSWEK